MLGRAPTEGEVEYARWTRRTSHYVLSTTLGKVNWEASRLVRGVGELRPLKEQSGGPVYVVGGAAIVSSLINERLIDELRLIVHPVILGGGTALFAGVKDRQTLRLVESDTGRSGKIVLSYRV
jgi:dihydrofolate reductase